mmetsp:Transcript_29622/g.50010  ORF Transcript_29622/g.50010 Transcript_29622/m.50010 type:complete len:169 (-) Transcript_29622:358-864(-)
MEQLSLHSSSSSSSSMVKKNREPIAADQSLKLKFQWGDIRTEVPVGMQEVTQMTVGDIEDILRGGGTSSFKFDGLDDNFVLFFRDCHLKFKHETGESIGIDVDDIFHVYTTNQEIPNANEIVEIIVTPSDLRWYPEGSVTYRLRKKDTMSKFFVTSPRELVTTRMCCE